MGKLIQVITNAVKYSPGGGDIIITSCVENASVHLSIQDHGIGISEAAINNIFMPYYHIDAKLTRHIQGTGLGLPIVKQIVEIHQGHIWVERGEGRMVGEPRAYSASLNRAPTSIHGIS